MQLIIMKVLERWSQGATFDKSWFHSEFEFICASDLVDEDYWLDESEDGLEPTPISVIEAVSSKNKEVVVFEWNDSLTGVNFRTVWVATIKGDLIMRLLEIRERVSSLISMQ